MVLFADDSTIVFNGDKSKDQLEFETEINTTLAKVIEWLEHNNLKVNLTKTKLMNFGNNNFDINYQGHRVDNTDSTKFLGIHIDKDMRWQTQLKEICQRVNKFAYALYQLSKIVEENSVLIAYNGYVDSTLRFGIMFWGNAVNIDKAFKAQKKCIRAICKIGRRDTCKQHFKRLHILTLYSLYIYEISVFVKANFHKFQKIRSQRYLHKIRMPLHHTALFKKNVFGMAPTIYNNLPDALLKIDDLHRFKTSLKSFLLDKSYYSIDEYLIDKNKQVNVLNRFCSSNQICK